MGEIKDNELSCEMVKGKKSVNWLDSKIEAEVRKDGAELIRQMLEALESSNVEWKQLADSGDAGFWRAEDQDYYQQSENAITAARAWLEDKP